MNCSFKILKHAHGHSAPLEENSEKGKYLMPELLVTSPPWEQTSCVGHQDFQQKHHSHKRF